MKNSLVHFLFILAVIGLPFGHLALAYKAVPLTPTEKSSVPGEQQAQVANLIFPPLQEKFNNNITSGNNLKRQIGIRRNTATALSPNLLPLYFKKEANGAHSYMLHIVSPEAKAMRIGLKITALPDSAILNFSTIASNHLVTGADINLLINTNIAADPNDSGARIYWSPTLPGDSATLQITLPSGVTPSALDLEIPAISHLSSNPAELANEAGSCYNDINCSSGWGNASGATVKMIFTGSGDTSICTGTLLADTDTTTTKPYLISAAHCISTQTEASSLETIWFHQSSSCNSSTVSSKSVTISGGATLLWSKGMSTEANGNNLNISFMLLNETPPEDAVYANWSTSTTPPGLHSSIHHPGGDFKKISNGQRQEFYDCWMTSSAIFNCIFSSSGNFVRIGWNTAGTESGSSGAGLFLTNERLTAILTGSSGANSCYSPYGYFSLFSRAYREGNLGQWLNAPAPEPEPVIVAPLNYLLLRN